MKSPRKLSKSIAVILLITTCLLSIPLIAMQFTNEVVWNFTDFIAAGVLLFGTGLTYELISRRMNSTIYRSAVGMAVGATLLLIWVNLAVGILGSENNPANILYGGVIGVGFLGAIITRLQPRGMAITLFAMALTQILIPVIAFLIWKPQDISTDAFLLTWHQRGMIGVFGVTAFFVILFSGAALLFWQANSKVLK
jgi:hypothetical protein